MTRLDLIDFDDFANIYLGYHVYGIFEYPDYSRRLVEKRASNASTVSVPNSSDGGNGDRRVSDLDDVGVDGVSGWLNNTQPLPHRASRSSSGLKEQGS